jgi:hypothetical protein
MRFLPFFLLPFLASARYPGEVFQGFDTVRNQPRQSALYGQTVSNSMSSMQVEFHLLKDQSSLLETLGVHAEVSAHYSTGITSVSGDFKSDYFHSMKTESSNTYMVVTAKTITGETQMVNANVVSNLFIPKTAAELAFFYSIYGDSYVTAVRTGAEYYACYVFRSSSREEQESISASWSISGSTLSASASTSGSINHFVEKASNQTRVDIYQQAFGVSGLAMPVASIDEIIKFAGDFTQKSATNPVVISYDTAGYESASPLFELDPIGPYFRQMSMNRNLLTISLDQVSLSPYSALLDVSDLIKACDDIQNIYSYYLNTGTSISPVPSDPKFKKICADALQDRLDIIDLIKSFISNPGLPLSNFTRVTSGYRTVGVNDVGLPYLNFQLSHQVTWGPASSGFLSGLGFPTPTPFECYLGYNVTVTGRDSEGFSTGNDVKLDPINSVTCGQLPPGEAHAYRFPYGCRFMQFNPSSANRINGEVSFRCTWYKENNMYYICSVMDDGIQLNHTIYGTLQHSTMKLDCRHDVVPVNFIGLPYYGSENIIYQPSPAIQNMAKFASGYSRVVSVRFGSHKYKSGYTCQCIVVTYSSEDSSLAGTSVQYPFDEACEVMSPVYDVDSSSPYSRLESIVGNLDPTCIRDLGISYGSRQNSWWNSNMVSPDSDDYSKVQYKYKLDPSSVFLGFSALLDRSNQVLMGFYVDEGVFHETTWSPRIRSFFK